MYNAPILEQDIQAGPVFQLLFGALYSVQQYILKDSWGLRAPNTYPTRGVRGLHEPHGVRLRGAEFSQYHQIHQRERQNGIASAPELPPKRYIWTIQYVLDTFHRGMAPGVSNRPSIYIYIYGTYCCRSIAYQVHKYVQVPGTTSYEHSI